LSKFAGEILLKPCLRSSDLVILIRTSTAGHRAADLFPGPMPQGSAPFVPSESPLIRMSSRLFPIT